MPLKKNTEENIYFSGFIILLMLISILLSYSDIYLIDSSTESVNTYLLSELAVQICTFLLPSILFLKVTKNISITDPSHDISLLLRTTVCICTTLILISLSSFFIFLHGEPEVLDSLTVSNAFDFFRITVVLCITPAICEEFAFRTVIFSFLKRYGSTYAVIFSALIFAFVHLSASNFLLYFMGGIFLGYCTVLTGSAVYAMICHFIYNIFTSFFSLQIQSAIYKASAPVYVLFFGSLLLISLSVLFYASEHIFFINSVNTQAKSNTHRHLFFKQIINIFRSPILILCTVVFILSVLIL